MPSEQSGFTRDAHLFQKSASFLATAEALKSSYARFDSLSGDFGPGDVDSVEYCASVAKPSAGKVQLQSGRTARGKTSRPTCPGDVVLANVARCKESS
jgi:hypothetical protein